MHTEGLYTGVGRVNPEKAYNWREAGTHKGAILQVPLEVRLHRAGEGGDSHSGKVRLQG